MVMLRPFIRWLLWTRRRFVLVVAASVVLAVIAARGPVLVSALVSRPPAPTTTAAAVAPPSTTTPPPSATSAPPPQPTTAPTDTTRADEDGPAPDEPRAIALRFARLWASPQTARREWLRRLEPLSTPEFAATVLAQVDPANVPAQAVIGTPRRVRSPEGTATFVVRFDTIQAQLELVRLSQARASELTDPDRSDETNSEPDDDDGDAEKTTWRVSSLQPLGDT